jgi:hypothetical protein
MKYRNYIFLFIVLVLLFSCSKKKENNQETKQEILDENVNKMVSSEEVEKEAMKEFLYNNDKYYKEFNKKIIYIEKANFGITGGENWIVRLDSRSITIYVINNKIIIKSYDFASFNLDDKSEFDIMQDIPGTRIGNSTSSFSDFNGDGIDEIFEYGFYGRGFFIIIWGYDEAKDGFVSYCEIPFDIIDPKKGPAPVEFMTYRGMFGFKVYFESTEVADGIGWVPDPNPKNDTWRFYTWDAEQRKYIEIGEVVD